MNDKILVRVYLPLIEEEYDIYIPINKKIGTIKQLIISTIVEMSDADLSRIYSLTLYDKQTGGSFDNNVYVKNSTIRNGTKLLLL